MHGALQFTKHSSCVHPFSGSLKPPWEVDRTHYIIIQQFVVPPACHAVSHVWDFTCALPEPQNAPFPLSCPIFHAANSGPTLKINSTAASCQTVCGSIQSDLDVPLLCKCCSLYSMAVITFYGVHLFVFRLS